MKRMGRLFWILMGVSIFQFIGYFVKSDKTSSSSGGDMLYRCARDGVDADNTFSEALSLCRSVMGSLNVDPSASADARGYLIIGMIFLGLALWRGYYVWTGKEL